MFLHQQALAGAIPSSIVEESAETIAQSSPSASRTATLTGLNLDGEFGREHAFEEKIANLTHRTNLGREVGQPWGLEDVLRWQNNWVSKVFRLDHSRMGEQMAPELEEAAGRSWWHSRCSNKAEYFTPNDDQYLFSTQIPRRHSEATVHRRGFTVSALPDTNADTIYP